MFFPATLNFQLSTNSRSQGAISPARRFAKAEVRGASQRESATLNVEARMPNRAPTVECFIRYSDFVIPVRIVV